MGRYVFGASALLLGAAGLVLHDQLVSNWRLPGIAAFIVLTSVAQIIGGGTMLFRKTNELGAVVLGAVYLVATITLLPGIAAHPNVYASWGNVAYQLALFVGAALVFGSDSSSPFGAALCRGAVMVFGLCNISFAFEQIEFLARTVSLVPKWVPPNAMFWAIATTIAFGLAGIALVTGYMSLLASRLLTLMLVVFGVTIWIPILSADPKTHQNWSEGIETFAIAGVAWIVADMLGRYSLGKKAG
jgi:uncharacterized membrane protein YphA (DoxX/SURF4 family)